MGNNVGNGQIKEFIANLKNRKAYEEKKAIKLGFSNFEDYVADKISNNFSDSSKVCKASKQRVRRKNKKKLKQSRLLLVVAVDVRLLSIGSNQIGTLN